LAGELAAVDGVLGAMRRSGVQDLQFSAAVGIGDHRDGEIRIFREAGSEFTELGGRQAVGLVPDLLGVGAAEDGLADRDHARYPSFARALARRAKSTGSPRPVPPGRAVSLR
jgi:hypothetical protein